MGEDAGIKLEIEDDKIKIYDRTGEPLALLNRLPKIEQITPVYSVGVTILFSWAIVTTIEVAINNWALYFGVADILSLFAYVMVGAFLESLLLISSLLMLSFILPQKIFGIKFVLRGTILTITFLGFIMYYYTQTPMGEALANINKWGMFFVITFVLLAIGESIKIVERFVRLMADRFIVFLYIYLPISFASIVIIIVRNLG